VKNWDRDEKLGDVFVASFSKTVVLDAYSDFINNFSIAMDLAKQESKRKSALADFLKVCICRVCLLTTTFNYTSLIVTLGQANQLTRSTVVLRPHGQACSKISSVHSLPSGI
jgi:hypothetical protein